MSISEIAIKVIGVILAVVGLLLLLSLVGVTVAGVHVEPWLLSLALGLLFVGGGVYIVRGGHFTP